LITLVVVVIVVVIVTVIVIVVFAVAAVIVIVWPVVDYSESNNISSMLNTPLFTIFAHFIDVKVH
jgi:hypothetical protein